MAIFVVIKKKMVSRSGLNPREIRGEDGGEVKGEMSFRGRRG